VEDGEILAAKIGCTVRVSRQELEWRPEGRSYTDITR
jgi:hypothetical protein